MEDKSRLEGLGGFLIIVGLGIILSPVKIVAQIFPIYSELFSNGSWAVLTTPGNEAYSPFWAPILIGELGINVILVGIWLFIAFLFFSKKRIFPWWYVGILAFTLAFIFIDALAIKLVLPDEPIFDPETTREFIRTLVVALVMVPYIFMSKRVKTTFVK